MGIRITHEDTGTVEIAQGEAGINYGTASMSTYNLLNCIAFGGRFDDGLRNGIFLTHELPEDVEILQGNLLLIREALRGITVTDTVLFRIAPSQAIGDIEPYIKVLSAFSSDLFGVDPTIRIYECKRNAMRCGEASITPRSVTTSLISLRPDKASFIPLFCTDNGRDILIKCPECGSVSTKFIQSFASHRGACDNNGKKPNLTDVPPSADGLPMCRVRGGTRKKSLRRSRRKRYI